MTCSDVFKILLMLKYMTFSSSRKGHTFPAKAENRAVTMYVLIQEKWTKTSLE